MKGQKWLSNIFRATLLFLKATLDSFQELFPEVFRGIERVVSQIELSLMHVNAYAKTTVLSPMY